MTDEVAALVLRDNDGPDPRALQLAARRRRAMLDVHVALPATRSSGRGRLDRALELLPTDDELAERAAAGGGPDHARVRRPAGLHEDRDRSASCSPPTLPEDPFLRPELVQVLPARSAHRYADQIREHPLRREIIATRVTNAIVDRAGTTFVFRLAEEDGHGRIPTSPARTWRLGRSSGWRTLWTQIEALDDVPTAGADPASCSRCGRLAERATRWLLRNRRQPLDIASTMAHFGPAVPLLADEIPRLFAGSEETDEAFRAAVAASPSTGSRKPGHAGGHAPGAVLRVGRHRRSLRNRS